MKTSAVPMRRSFYGVRLNRGAIERLIALSTEGFSGGPRLTISTDLNGESHNASSFTEFEEGAEKNSFPPRLLDFSVSVLSAEWGNESIYFSLSKDSCYLSVAGQSASWVRGHFDVLSEHLKRNSSRFGSVVGPVRVIASSLVLTIAAVNIVNILLLLEKLPLHITLAQTVELLIANTLLTVLAVSRLLNRAFSDSWVDLKTVPSRWNVSTISALAVILGTIGTLVLVALGIADHLHHR